ncbi:hypothetical protein [Brevibacillus fulvus]|uniref:Uncharacterized protein n=1 Tax=Brevibacillus fulvus TaxID=1125967 RepID=A0A938XV03_9BACL|nr:hypothetical protein [Brevibacillus fulvus]MBM7590978.1 hypothetical protein [Brevibacillus fulvus]
MMNENGILLGKRQFLYFKEQNVSMEGWVFSIAPGFRMIAGGSANPIQTFISIYRDSEKVAQLLLTHKRYDSHLAVLAVASDITLEVSPVNRMVRLQEKL